MASDNCRPVYSPMLCLDNRTDGLPPDALAWRDFDIQELRKHQSTSRTVPAFVISSSSGDTHPIAYVVIHHSVLSFGYLQQTSGVSKMARLNLHRSSSARPESSAATPVRTELHSRTTTTLSPSPATSDKENRDLDEADTPGVQGKGKVLMGPPKLPTPNSDGASGADHRSAKRRRIEGHDTPTAERAQESHVPRERDVKDVYDPDQPIEKRQQIRKSLRELHRDLNGMQANICIRLPIKKS